MLDVDAVHSGVLELRKCASKRRCPLPRRSHGYAVQPPLPERVVERFEKQTGISLPEDYRLFITEIGAGGAGPALGLLSVDVNSLGQLQWLQWTGQPWPGVAKYLGGSFQHDVAWNRENRPQEDDYPDDESFDSATEQWWQDYCSPHVTSGAIPVADCGCGLSVWLVVNGPRRGTLWFDGRADSEGLSIMRGADDAPLSFARWYMEWLEECLSILASRSSARKKSKTKQRTKPETDSRAKSKAKATTKTKKKKKNARTKTKAMTTQAGSKARTKSKPKRSR